MGMYDYISIPTERLQLSKSEIEDICGCHYGKFELQTKSFECEMSMVHLNDDSIVIGAPYYAEDDEKEKQTVITDYHGFVTFYTSGTSHWFYEFTAKYTDGKLIEVKRLHESEAFWNKDRKSVNHKELSA